MSLDGEELRELSKVGRKEESEAPGKARARFRYLQLRMLERMVPLKK